MFPPSYKKLKPDAAVVSTNCPPNVHTLIALGVEAELYPRFVVVIVLFTAVLKGLKSINSPVVGYAALFVLSEDDILI